MALRPSHVTRYGSRPTPIEGQFYSTTCSHLPEFDWGIDYGSHIHMIVTPAFPLTVTPLFDVQWNSTSVAGLAVTVLLTAASEVRMAVTPNT